MKRALWVGGSAALLVPAVALTTLTVTGAMAEPVAGWPDAGGAVRWVLPTVQGLRDVAAVLTVGLSVLVAVVLPGEVGAGPGLGPLRTRAVRLAAATGTVWTVVAVAVLVLTYADVAGRPLLDLGRSGGELVSFVTDFELGRSLSASLALVAAATTVLWLATGVTAVGIAALLAIAALLPLALTGHSGVTANHALAVDALAVHLVGVTVWVGGLAGLVILRPALLAGLAVSVRRFSSLAGWCFVLVAGSGVAGALARTNGWSGLMSPYGALLGAKVLALALIGAAGWWHRRRSLAPLEGPTPSGKAFAVLAGGELAVMSVAVGLAVALSRTSPAAGASARPSTLTESLLGYPMPPPLGAAQWFTQWRIDTPWVPIAVLAACWYVAAAVRLRRRRDRWATSRTVSWVSGCVVLIWATSAGPGVYGRVLFSMHMVQHMTIGTLVPILLVLGAPVTLALRTLRPRHDGSRGAREWLLALVHSRVFRALAHPAVAPILFVGSLIAFYYSPALELSLRTHTGHVLMTAHFIAVGYLFAWLICGPDPGPRRPPYPLRLVILIGTMAFHAFIGVSMMGSVEILGQDWFASLDRPWGPTLAEDQYRGGALAWALGDYPVAILTLAMALAWIRDDDRESRRFDRQADRDGDAELRRYNAMLERMAARDADRATSRRRP